ncbi:MAG: redoxin domain-containing protein [Bacteroidota bacterium]
MKYLALFLAIFICLNARSQDSTKKASITYKTYTSFPAFPLMALDSSRFNSISVLAKNQPLVVIYFSPTCSHCQHQAEEITSHMNEFKNVKFLMVSSYPITEIKEFATTYAIQRFQNITLAHDPNFSMGQFYELRSLPGIYVYDKKGLFKKNFETNVMADVLWNALNL